jgi:hypothetical protein
MSSSSIYLMPDESHYYSTIHRLTKKDPSTGNYLENSQARMGIQKIFKKVKGKGIHTLMPRELAEKDLQIIADKNLKPDDSGRIVVQSEEGSRMYLVSTHKRTDQLGHDIGSSKKLVPESGEGIIRFTGERVWNLVSTILKIDRDICNKRKLPSS